MGRRSFTVNDLAATLGVHRVTASRIRNGHIPLDIDQAERLAAWLDIDLATVFESAVPTGDAA